MADRRDYFFRQPVTEAELDEGFELLERADRAIVGDLGLIGLLQNGDVTEKAGTPNLSVDVSGPGVVYDQDGQRISWGGSAQNVDCSVDESGVTTAVVTPGNIKYLSIFVAFDRELLNPRVDGASATVFYERNETFQFNVVQGAEGVAPSLPPLRGDEILLADVELAEGDTQILNAAVSYARTQYLVRTTGTALLAERNLIDALDELDLRKVGGVDLSSQAVGDPDGASRVGIDAIATAPTAEVGTPTETVASTLRAFAVSVLAAINDRMSLVNADTLTAVKTLGSGARIRLSGASGGNLDVAASRLRELPFMEDARTAGATLAWLGDEAASLAYEGGRYKFLHGCRLTSTAGTYIATATGTSTLVEMGANGVLRTRTRASTVNDTWLDAEWVDHIEFNGAKINFPTPDNPAAGADPGINRAEAKNQIKAWGVVASGVLGTGTIYDMYGAESVESETDRVVINFSNAFASLQYFFSATMADAETYYCSVSRQNASSAAVVIRLRADDSLVNPTGAVIQFYFLALGEQA